MRRIAISVGIIALFLFMGSSPALATEGLHRGDSGGTVLHLQRRLAQEGFYRGPFDGEYGAVTAQAVMAFHKYLGLERTFDWTAEDWRYLDLFEPPPPSAEDHVEVDLDRQVLVLYRGGTVAIMPVSSGSGGTYRGRGGSLARARTPEGTFSFYRHINGMRRSYLGALWRPWYFHGGYAIHGSSSVPAYPASHGCIRVPNWEADWLHTQLQLGMDVTVYRSGGVTPPELPPLPPSPVTLAVDHGSFVWRAGSRPLG